MGGDREFTTPAKEVITGQPIGNLRVHENGGEVHFHDDDAKCKVAVPVAEMFAAWDKISDGRMAKFKYHDTINGTVLRMRVVKGKKGPTDINVEVKRMKPKEIVGMRSNDFQAFERFMKGSVANV